MAQDLTALVKQAVRDGVAARSRFYASLQEPDEQELGAAATPEQLSAAERTLGTALPPSYKAFLMLHNGWKMVTASMDLFSIEDVLRVAKDPKTEKWRKIALDAGEGFAAKAIVIGASRFAAAKLLLDPEQTGADGEMAVVRHDKVEEETYPNFLAYIRASTEEFTDIAGDIEDGFDFSDV